MESQLLGFFQDRMATAYEEQTWAVALVSGMNAFIASNAELIRKGFKRWVLVSGITTISLLATAFVWSRHCIFVHYDKCLKTVLETASFYSICSPNRVPQFYKSLVQYSGVTMYTMIIIGLWFVALRMLFIDKGRKGD
jgi:hypothetical protein